MTLPVPLNRLHSELDVLMFTPTSVRMIYHYVGIRIQHSVSVLLGLRVASSIFLMFAMG